MRNFQELLLDQMLIKDRDIVFDLDGTLIEGDIGETLYYHTLLTEYVDKEYKLDWLKPIGVDSRVTPVPLVNEGAEIISSYRKKLALGDFEKAYLTTARHLERYQRDNIETLVQAFLSEKTAPTGITYQRSINGRFQKSFIPYGVRIKQEMIRLVQFFKQQGANLWIVSASPQMVCEFVAKKFGIDIQQVLGTCVSEEENDVQRFPWGSSKLKVLLESGVTHPLFVFGDGEGDVEMLEVAEYPVVVEGNSRKIIELAIRKNWWIFSSSGNLIKK